MKQLLLLAFAALLAFSSRAQSSVASADHIHRVIAEHFSPEAPGGSILVAHGGKVVFEGAVGMADLKNKVPLNGANQFWIASITKQFTAVAILQLAEAGKLQLDDEIQEHVEFPVKEHPITIEHLLTHTSGIPDFTPNEDPHEITIPRLLEHFKDLPLNFAPGTNWSYSNSGYLLLTAIIEKVSGKAWPDYAAENLFSPAGMTNTTASNSSDRLANEAIGYSSDSAGWKPADMLDLTWVLGAGNIRSTVGDLWKWHQSLYSGQLISPEMLDKAHQPYTLEDGRDHPYGYGWRLQNVQGSPTLEHAGWISGFTSNCIYLPEEDIFVAVLANRESLDAHVLAPKLAALVMGAPYSGETVPLAPDLAEEYIGVYVDASGSEWHVDKDGSDLTVQRAGSERFGFDHHGNDHFSNDEKLITVTFDRQNGVVTGARLLTRKHEEILTRTDKKLPEPRKEIKLSSQALQQYVGEYELEPGFTFTFRIEDGKLLLKPTGEAEVEVYAEGDNRFFLKIVDATILFHAETDGTVNRLTYTQGEAMEALRIPQN